MNITQTGNKPSAVSNPPSSVSPEVNLLENTALHNAVLTGKLDKVEAVLLSQPGLINEQNKSGETALHLAAESANLAAVNLLLASGARANIENKYGQIALELVPYSEGPNKVVLALLKPNLDKEPEAVLPKVR